MPGSPLIVIYAPLALAFLFFCLVCGLFLVVRAMKTKLYHIIYLSIYFFITFVYFTLSFITYIQPTSLWWPRISLYQVAVIANVLFIQKVFYGKSKGPLKYVLALVISLAILNVITAVVRDLFDGQFIDLVVGRVILTTGGSTELAIVTGWQSSVSFSAYRKYEEDNIEPHVRVRYLFFGISGVLLLLFAAIDVPATILSLVVTFDYYIMETISIIIILLYSVINFLTWVMPGRFKRYLNRYYKPSDAEPLLTEDEIMKQLETSTDR